MKVLNNLKTGTKLIATYLAIALIIVAVAVAGFLSIRSVNSGIATMYADRLLPTQQLGHINEALLKIQVALYRLILNREDRDELRQDIAGQIKVANRNLRLYEASYLVKEEVEGLDRLNRAWTGYQQALSEAMRFIKTGNATAALQSINQGSLVFAAQSSMDQVITNLIAVQTHVGVDLKRKGDKTFNRAKWTMTLAGLIGVLFAVVLGLTISRGITVPLSAITASARTASGGNMDAGPLGNIVTRRDEIGVLAWAFTLMAGQLKVTLEGLRQSREELEKRVQERTRELQQSNERLENEIEERRQAETQLMLRSQELARTNTDLGTANKELDAFAYSVSHDLRAPLRHVDGFVELLRKRVGNALDHKSRHYMETISKSVQRMGLLIDDLLYFSRMGRQALSFAPVNMKALARKSILELEREAAGKDIDWCIGDLPVALGDATLLRVVFDNLISNAIKFSYQEKKIRIEIRAMTGRNSETVFVVRDNGVGFDMKYVDKLFGVFQRLHNKDKYKGTGIGLASVHRIISRHGGRVWARGKPGKGAVFFFSLPYKQEGDSHEKR